MKILKSALVAFSLATTMAAFSTTAVAFEEGRLAYTPANAIKLTVEKANAAKAAIDAGADGQEVAALIKKASDASKEINANDKLDRQRQKANKHLKKARKAAKKGDLEAAKSHLELGIKGMSSLTNYL